MICRRMAFESKSQAGQDRLALALLGDGISSFLDIGANEPVTRSNTYALEMAYGWRGLLVDNSADSMAACEKHRKSAFLLTDASQPQDWIGAPRTADQINWGVSLYPPRVIDYLSLDVDQATLQTLKNLPLDQVRFRVMTVEHDAYRAGPEPRAEMLAILNAFDYDVLCADVCDHGLPFEIWAVDPKDSSLPNEVKDRFRRDKPTEWREFFS